MTAIKIVVEKLLVSAEGGAKMVHQITKPSPWRGGNCSQKRMPNMRPEQRSSSKSDMHTGRLGQGSKNKEGPGKAWSLEGKRKPCPMFLVGCAQESCCVVYEYQWSGSRRLAPEGTGGYVG